MSTPDPTTRSATRAVTATTLATLVAMVASTAVVSGGITGAIPTSGRQARIVHTEVMASLGESHAARAVAAVMAVAARDLLMRTSSAALLPTAELPGVEQDPEPVPSRPGPDAVWVASLHLDERVLDLPPPCA